MQNTLTTTNTSAAVSYWSCLLRTTTGERGSSLDTDGVWLRLGESSVSWATSFLFSPSYVPWGEDTSNSGLFSSLEGLFYVERHRKSPRKLQLKKYILVGLNIKVNEINCGMAVWWFIFLYLPSSVHNESSPSAWVKWGNRLQQCCQEEMRCRLRCSAPVRTQERLDKAHCPTTAHWMTARPAKLMIVALKDKISSKSGKCGVDTKNIFR